MIKRILATLEAVGAIFLTIKTAEGGYINIKKSTYFTNEEIK